MPASQMAALGRLEPSGWRARAPLELAALLRSLRTCAAMIALVSVSEAVSASELPRAFLLNEAQVIDPDGGSHIVKLPNFAMLEAEESGPVTRRYLWSTRFASAPKDFALYFSGLEAHARASVNGHVVSDFGAPADARLPRSIDRVVLIPVADEFWRTGDNQIELEAAGPHRLSVSALELGPKKLLATHQWQRLLGMVVAPAIVAAVVGAIGLGALLLWLRLREPLYGYFGAGTLGWALHSTWSVLPWPLLPPNQRTIWWTCLYTFFVAMVSIFSVRFVGWKWSRFEHVAIVAVAGGPPVLYVSLGLGLLDETTDFWRLGLIGIVVVTVWAIGRAAVDKGSIDSFLMTLIAAACLSFAIHDWLISQFGSDNNPIYLVPYAGLLFAAFMAHALVDRLVNSTRQISSMNSELEKRVTEQTDALHDAMQKMRRQRDRAEDADRSKSRFLAAASHDLRQPAHALGLYLAALRAEPLNDSQADVARRMSGSLAALDGMFNTLLDISRMDAGVITPRPQSFSLTSMLRRLADDQAPHAETRGLRLALRLPPADAVAFNDPGMVERIVRNLIENAIKYTAQGGVLLSCRMRGAVKDAPVVGAPPRGPHWLVEVWDTGIGIAEGQRAKIFDEFFQVGNIGHDRSMGLGLGLSIVRRLIELLDLSLLLHSRVDRGSRFALCLPISESATCEDLHDALPADATDPWRSLAGTIVVTIEDDDEVRTAMSDLFRRWGCEVIEGECAADIQAQLAGRATPSAVIADYRLASALNGPVEVRKLMDAWRFDVPVLFVSGETSQDALLEMKALDATVLGKPANPKRLRVWLERVLYGELGALGKTSGTGPDRG